MMFLFMLLIQLPSSAAPPTPLRLAWNTARCADVLPGEQWLLTWDAAKTPQPYTQPTNKKIATWNLAHYKLHITIQPPICLPVGDCVPLEAPLPMVEFWPETYSKDTQMMFTVFEGGTICYQVQPVGSFFYVY